MCTAAAAAGLRTCTGRTVRTLGSECLQSFPVRLPTGRRAGSVSLSTGCLAAAAAGWNWSSWGEGEASGRPPPCSDRRSGVPRGRAPGAGGWARRKVLVGEGLAVVRWPRLPQPLGRPAGAAGSGGRSGSALLRPGGGGTGWPLAPGWPARGSRPSF